MKIAHLYFETSMAYSFNGLKNILGKKVLRDDECAIFINKSWTGVKLLTPQNTLLYCRRNRIEPDTIKYLPSCVNGSALDYDKALDAAIRAKFKRLKI